MLGLWTDIVSVVATGRAPGCDGTSIASTLRLQPTCVEGGAGARVSPDGTKVAVAVRTGSAVFERAVPGASTPVAVVEFEIQLVDVASGDRRVLQGRGYAYAFVPPGVAEWQPPDIRWNAQGTHFVVRWPASYGI
jgi:hypothetical protein